MSLETITEAIKGLTRDDIARRAAQELKDSFYVNLGIGIPSGLLNPKRRGRDPAVALPLTGADDLIITDLAATASDKVKGGLILLELVPSANLADVESKTQAAFDRGAFA